MDNKTCGTCGYFLKHYIFYENCYQPVFGSGQCLNNKKAVRSFQKIYKNALPCESWKPQEDTDKLNRETRINYELKIISRSIYHISKIINEDK